MNTSPNSQPTNGGLPYNTGDIANRSTQERNAPWSAAACCRFSPASLLAVSRMDVARHSRAKRFASTSSLCVWDTIRLTASRLAEQSGSRLPHSTAFSVGFVRALVLATIFAATAAEVTPSQINLNSTPVVDASPEKELASFTIAEGFEVSLFASEKDGIAKPIAHRFDRLGRLWVIGSTTYPQVKPGEEPNDYVKIVEDTDGDGKADKVTTFADGLYIPTGLEVDADGRGAWVGEGSKLWHMRDEDGDGKADKKEVVLRGFGTGDNHQNINSFRWSPGGELYMSQGLHAFSHVETPHGVVHLEEAGYFRFNPRTMKLTPFWGGAGDPQNPWGFVWDDWGNLFVQAGNNGSIQDALVSAFEGGCGPRPPQIWEGAKGRKGSNPEFVGTAHFPPDWQGRLIVPGYINNAVWTLRFSPDGSTFKAVDDVPLIKSSSGSFRPMDAKFAPDGSLYIADWYNPVIGHYQASFRHPDRDKVHGRIWRVTAKGRDLVKPPAFLKTGTASKVEDVVKGLESDERFVRDFARRILGAMKKEEVLPAVERWMDAGRVGVPPAAPRVPRGASNVEPPTTGKDAAAIAPTEKDAPRESEAQGEAPAPVAPTAAAPTMNGRERVRVIERDATRTVVIRERPFRQNARFLFDGLCIAAWHETTAPNSLTKAHYSSEAALRVASATLLGWRSETLYKRMDMELFIALYIADSNPRVRLASVVAAGNGNSQHDVRALIAAGRREVDPAISFALREAVVRLKPVWEPMLALPDKGGLTEEQIAFLRNPAAAKPAAPKADPVVAKFVADALKPGAVVGKATPEFVAALSAEVRANGDAAKGAAVFKKAELGCTACHKIGNDGGTIGPDLNNIGSAQPLDFIIGAVIEPSREIKEGFEARIVTTKSGGTFTGFRRASAPDELALFDGATGKETKLKLTDITDNKPLGSLMPAGLVDKLTREELRDLFAYLTSLGKAK